jgi:hypothetical protein
MRELEERKREMERRIAQKESEREDERRMKAELNHQVLPHCMIDATSSVYD